MNEDLISSAVSFLQDPNVTTSPLNKKIEFLQSKGLNEQEIEEALNRANNSSTATTTSIASNGLGNGQSTLQSAYATPAPPIDYYNVAPPVPERTWKDYFIMATATAGVTYGLYQVVSKYVIPSIIPPTQSNIDQDKAQIDEEFIKIDKLLEELSTEQKEIKQLNEEKLKEVDQVINNVNDFLTKYNKDKLTFDDDLRLMKLEIDNLRNSIEKNLKLTKDNLKDDLQDINSELTSLKSLIKLRSTKESDRKITPVSSIPSASEILKRAKQSSSSPAPVAATASAASPSASPVAAHTPVSTPAQASNSSSASPLASSLNPEPEAPKPNEVRFTEPTTNDGVTAAGIPEWQMKHKLQEEQDRQKNQDSLVNETINKVGVPAWQLNS